MGSGAAEAGLADSATRQSCCGGEKNAATTPTVQSENNEITLGPPEMW